MNPSKPAAIHAGNNILDKQDIRNTLGKIIKYWYWVVFLLLVSLATAFLFLRKSTLYYGATTSILIKPQQNAIKDALSKSFMGNSVSNEDVYNEMEILKSRGLLAETIRRMDLGVSYYIKGRLRTGELYQGIPFAVVDAKALDPALSNTPFNIHIINAEKYTLSIEGGDVSYSKTHAFGEPVVHEKFSFIINSKPEQIRSITKPGEINYQFRINDPGFLIDKYKEALTLTKAQEASVITLNIEDEIPERAVAFLDTLTRLYIERSVSVQKEINSNTLKFVETQLNEVEGILNSVESNLEQYQRQTGTVASGEQSQLYLQQKADVEEELARLSVQMNSVDYLYNSLTSGGDISAISPTLLSDEADPALSTAFTELSGLLQKKTNLLFSNTKNSPVVKEVEQQIEMSKKNVLQMVLNMRRSMVLKYNTLSGQLGTYKSRISTMPTTMKGLVNINRKVSINEKIYLFLLETRAQTVIERASIVPDKTIIEAANATGLLHPVKLKVYLMSAGAGLAASFVLIFLLGLFYNFIESKDELTALTTLPVIGIVGKSKEARDNYLAVEKNPQSLTAEAFRVIRTNLAYFGYKSSSKSVLITSTMPGEGKTFCAVNIATILAKARKKVLLMDLDLHKPRQANAFNLKNEVGITNYLVGSATLGEITVASPVENLDIILTGPRTPNASELILEPKLEELIDTLKQTYEYVIIDTAPVGVLSDALMLMKYSDLNIYVLRAHFAKREFVELAHGIMEKNNIKSMSFVLNQVSQKRIPAGYGGTYYYK